MKHADRVQPQTIVDIYKEEGMTISLEQAKIILEFMYMLADIALDIAEREVKKEKDLGH